MEEMAVEIRDTLVEIRSCLERLEACHARLEQNAQADTAMWKRWRDVR